MLNFLLEVITLPSLMVISIVKVEIKRSSGFKGGRVSQKVAILPSLVSIGIASSGDTIGLVYHTKLHEHMINRSIYFIGGHGKSSSCYVWWSEALWQLRCNEFSFFTRTCKTT